MSKASDALQKAFEADGNAIHSLICNRVPCNQALADDPFVQVDAVPVLSPPAFQVGVLGMLNAVLEASGLPKIAAKWGEPNEEGRRVLLGFCDYEVP